MLLPSSVQTRLAENAAVFKDRVWPRLQREDRFLNCDLQPVEDQRKLEIFDKYAGIDAWIIHRGRRMIQAVGSRIQNGCPRPWNTHTIRYQCTSGYKTEFEKVLNALDDDECLRPHLSIHSYLDEASRLLAIGCINTRSLFTFAAQRLGADDHLPKRDRRVYVETNSQDGNRFIVVRWHALRSEGINLDVIKCQNVVPPRERDLHIGSQMLLDLVGHELPGPQCPCCGDAVIDVEQGKDECFKCYLARSK